MTKRDKIRFVKNLTGSVAKELIGYIQENKIPEEWDGFELRRYLADKFEREAYLTMGKKRLQEYRNTLYTSNI